MFNRKSKTGVEQLVDEFKREKSLLGKVKRWLLFFLGFSQCRYCIYCNVDGSEYRGMRESALLKDGKCKWGGSSITANLSYKELRTIHRCPAFTPILYNFKDYAIDPNEIENIYSKRKNTFFTWMGWLIAVLIAILTLAYD